MGPRKKTLAQELAELYNPAPTKEHDPDALDLGDGAQLASDDEYEEARREPSRRAPEKGMLLRGDITLEDAAYRGRKSSRAAVFGEQDEDGDGLDDDRDGAMSDNADEDEDLDLDLDLGDSGDVEGDEEEDDEEAGADRRAMSGLAGPSGRGSAAAATKGTGKRSGGSSQAAAAKPAKGRRPAASESDATDEEGEEDDERDDDGDGMLPSGSQSDLDDEEADGEDEDEDLEDGDMDQDDDEEGLGAPSGAAARLKKAARQQRGSSGGGGDELDELEAEYEALQQEDEQQLAALRQKGERDRVKGVAVRNQQLLYERALEQRILLQKCLQASNGLPRPDTHAALRRTQPDIREGFAQLATAAHDTLSQLLELQRTFMGRTAGIALPPAANGSAASQPTAGTSGRDANGSRSAAKRPREEEEEEENGGGRNGLDALWQRISSHHAALAPYRDASLDSWHRRTVLSSGSGALRNSGLRALNQSISSQVQALMRDPAKFIKRTRLTLAACPRVLCEPARGGAGTLLGADPNAEEEDRGLQQGQNRQGDGLAASAAGATSASVAADVTEEERDAETYDDSEFYQQLLKEFLDKGLAEGAAGAAPKAAKKRKQVDRRASKGRKLRYHVQDKLVAFMAPVDFELPSFAANLFANLFGHAGK